MKRNLFAVFASLMVAGTMAAAQESQAPAAPGSSSQGGAQSSSQSQAATDPNDKAFTGCLIQGSGPNVYILDNAKIEDDASAKGQRYLLEINAQPEQLKPVLNSHVRIVGAANPNAATAAAPSAGAAASDQKSGETTLPKVMAKRITRLAATCPATSSASSVNPSGSLSPGGAASPSGAANPSGSASPGSPAPSSGSDSNSSR